MRKLFAAMVLWGVTGAGVSAQDLFDVPLEVVDGRLVVPVVTADGTELRFALSTGTATTVLSESTARLLNGAPAPSLGGVPIVMDHPAVILDDRLGSLAGMIAPNTLNQYDILVNAPAGRLLLKAAGGPVDWGIEMSEPVRLRVLHGIVLALEVEIEGRIFGAALDLGTPAMIGNGGLQRALGLEADALATVLIGGSAFEAPISVEDLDILQRFDPDGAGFLLVGAPIAFDCAISLSWVRREMRTCVR